MMNPDSTLFFIISIIIVALSVLLFVQAEIGGGIIALIFGGLGIFLHLRGKKK